MYEWDPLPVYHYFVGQRERKIQRYRDKRGGGGRGRDTALAREASPLILLSINTR